MENKDVRIARIEGFLAGAIFVLLTIATCTTFLLLETGGGF